MPMPEKNHRTTIIRLPSRAVHNPDQVDKEVLALLGHASVPLVDVERPLRAWLWDVAGSVYAVLGVADVATLAAVVGVVSQVQARFAALVTQATTFTIPAFGVGTALSTAVATVIVITSLQVDAVEVAVLFETRCRRCCRSSKRTWTSGPCRRGPCRVESRSIRKSMWPAWCKQRGAKNERPPAGHN